MVSPTLHGVFCTSKISAETLKKFLASSTAAALSVDVTPSLRILTHDKLELYIPDDVSHPDKITNFESPFYGMNETDIASLLAAKGATSQINTGAFIILDERTSCDSSVLLVLTQDEEGKLQTVRTSFEMSLQILQALDMRTMGMKEVQSWVDESGVYRGDSSKPIKGGPTARMQLR